MNRNLRDQSRVNWTSLQEKATVDEINCGSLMRIADASELIAMNYQALIAEIERVKQARNYWEAEAKAQKRTAASLRGVITKQRVIIDELGQRAR